VSEQEVASTLQPHSLKGRTHFREHSLVWTIILKWMLGNKTLRRDLDLFSLGYELNSSFRDEDKEILESILV
jgi:hypothetical protein